MAMNTAITLTSVPHLSVRDAAITLTARVVPVPPATGTPTGTVKFIIGANRPTLTSALVDGQAAVTVHSRDIASRTVVAVYSGDATFAPSSSAPLAETAIAAPPLTGASTLTTSLATPVADTPASTLNHTVYGEPVALAATVTKLSSGTGTPTGTVTFTITGGPTLNAPLNATGQASTSTSTLTAGPHTVTATYSGDACFATSTSAPVAHTVQSTITTSLTAVPTTIRTGTRNQFIIAALSATLINKATGTGISGQTITFTADPGTGPITVGTAVTAVSGTAILTNVVVSADLASATGYIATFAGAAGLSPATATATLTFG